MGGAGRVDDGRTGHSAARLPPLLIPLPSSSSSSPSSFVAQRHEALLLKLRTFLSISEDKNLELLTLASADPEVSAINARSALPKRPKGMPPTATGGGGTGLQQAKKAKKPEAGGGAMRAPGGKAGGPSAGGGGGLKRTLSKARRKVPYDNRYFQEKLARPESRDVALPEMLCELQAREKDILGELLDLDPQLVDSGEIGEGRAAGVWLSWRVDDRRMGAAGRGKKREEPCLSMDSAAQPNLPRPSRFCLRLVRS